MYRLLCFFITISICFSAFSQQDFPYKLTYTTELPMLVGGGLMAGASALIRQEVTPLSMVDLAALNRQDVWGFDRFATNNYSTNAEKVSDIGLFSSLAFPALLALDRQNRPHIFKIGLISFESALITAGLTNFTKVTALRTRPLAYNENAPLELRTIPETRFSFWSGHTAITACFSFSTAQMYSDLHPNSKWKPVVWTAAAVVPAVTGYARIRAGKHFLSDVLVGYTVGALVGIFVPRLHRIKRKPEKPVFQM